MGAVPMPGAFYMKAVSWAVEAGVTMGLGDGSFGVGKPCNRAETVTFLSRAMADGPHIPPKEGGPKAALCAGVACLKGSQNKRKRPEIFRFQAFLVEISGPNSCCLYA